MVAASRLEMWKALDRRRNAIASPEIYGLKEVAVTNLCIWGLFSEDLT